MFNWSWSLRAQTEYQSPVGPSFTRAQTIHLYLNGIHISLKAPRQRTKIPYPNITLKGSFDVNDLDSSLYDFNGVRWRSTTAIMRQWDFYGELFSGKLGGITMSATIMSPVDAPKNLNYFHPRALEVGVADCLTALYGSKFSADNLTQEWLAPVNWRPSHNFPCIAVRFDAVNSIVRHHGPHSFLAIPLSKSHYILFQCDIDRAIVFSNKTPKPTIDEWIDLKPFTALANQVLDSIKVELSPQALAEQEEALRGLSEEEKQLVKEYPPLKWTPPASEIDENWREKYSNN